MADRYCILPDGGTGDWTDVAIWRDVGGNSVSRYPSTEADTAIFRTSVSLTNAPSPFACGLIIENQVTVEIVADTLPAETRNVKRWTIDGTLRMTLGQEFRIAGGLFMEDNSHVVANHPSGDARLALDTVENMTFGDGCSVAVPGGRIWINGTGTGGYYENAIPKAKYLAEVFLFSDPATYVDRDYDQIFVPGLYEFPLLRISGRCIRNQSVGLPITVHGGQATLKVGELAFYRSNLGHTATFLPEDADIEITGDIVTDIVNTGPLAIEAGSKPWRLTGARDQVIDMPTEFAGHVSFDTRQKTAGTTHFRNAVAACDFGVGAGRNVIIGAGAKIKCL